MLGRQRGKLVAVALVVSLFGTQLTAREPEVAVRLMKIKASAKKADKPEIARELEPVRAQLEALPLGCARYDVIGNPETKKGGSVAFELPGSHRLEVQAAPARSAPGSFDLKLKITRDDGKKKRVEVSSVDMQLKDGETLIQKANLKLENEADLLLAITPTSR